MRTILILLAVLSGCHWRAQSAVRHHRPDLDRRLDRIAFGSCLYHTRPVPALDAMAAAQPDLVLLIGDNVYADTDDPERMRAAYARLDGRPEYRRLVDAAPILAVWDDHDYGRNDAGRELPSKQMAKDAMLAHFDEPARSPRRTRPGVYDAVVVGPPGRRVQIILLDMRWFRSPLAGTMGHYRPQWANDATMLGEEQWRWLETELQRPAEVRLLVSSIQVLAAEHPYEKWDNFPRERERLLRLIGETNAAGVVVLSGDRHRAELSRLDDSAVGYPLYDLTSSSLNLPLAEHEPNALRIGEQILTPNFGIVEIDWDGHPPSIRLELRDERGTTPLREDVPLAALHTIASPR